MKLNRIGLYGALLALSVLTACQSVNYVTRPNYPTEAALVANSYQNGLITEIDMSYEQAFYNLKQAYQRCVAFTTDEQLVFTDNRLEKHLGLGTLFARTEGGAYLLKATLESISPDKTRMSLFLPKQYHFAQARFKQDIVRALGKDQQCNIGAIVPLQS